MSNPIIATISRLPDNGPFEIVWNHAPIDAISNAIESLNQVLEFRKYVEAGAQWLDDFLGSENWRDLIDLDELDMEDTSNCIVAQTLGNKISYRLLDTDGDFASDRNVAKYSKLGFCVNTGEEPDTEKYKMLYRDLTQAWKNYLLEKTD